MLLKSLISPLIQEEYFRWGLYRLWEAILYINFPLVRYKPKNGPEQ
jgi:hypothetical protein